MIGIYLGEQNSGKTLSMVYTAYKYFLNDYDIYSNVKLQFPYTKLTKELLQEYTEGQKQFKKAIFLIDEMYLFFDSRSFGSKTVKIFTYFLLQTSKRGVHLYGTAQYFNTLEKRLRENTFFQCFCNRTLFNPKTQQFNSINDNSRFLKKEENEQLYIKQSYLMKKNIDGMFPSYYGKIFYLKATSKLFSLYDTTELLAI